MACAFATPHVASAESQALLVGVGKHAHAAFNLPGIDKDIYMIRDAAEYLGFAARNIRTLQDEDATLAAFRRELQRIGKAEYGDGDRVLIYFSGHGAQVPDDGGDEADGKDEVLVLHDTRPGSSGLSSFLRDDEFGALLAGVKAANVLVLVDSCHSGTTTKSFPGIAAFGVPKFIRNSASPYVGGDVQARSLVPEPRPTHVLLSAAADNELAQATGQGSAFTLGVSEAVKAAKEAGSLTPRQLQQAVAKHVDDLLTRLGRPAHNPQLSGADPQLAANLFFRPASGQAPTRRRLEKLAAGLPQMPMRAVKALRVGEKLAFSLDVPRAGYLNVVNVNPQDEATVLFPNAYHPRDNKVAAGRLEIPTDDMAFDLVAREPLGESVTVAFLTAKPVNLYQDTLRGRDRSGKVVATLAPLSAQGGVRMRSIVVERREGAQNYAAKVVTSVSR